MEGGREGGRQACREGGRGREGIEWVNNKETGSGGSRVTS